tara:strand:- start:609 stop:1028 length:420 start_codon:yes stop_codon:yes gene_type:complete
MAGNITENMAKRTQANLEEVVARTMWPTPTASDSWSSGLDRKGIKGKHNLGLGTAARMWPTASARDWKDTPGMARTKTNPDGSERQRTDQLARAVYSEQDSHKGDGSLNPTWVEWLMGFPSEWTDLNVSGTQSSRKSQK